MSDDTRPPTSARRRRAGTTLVVVGIALIVGAVLWLLEASNGPGSGPTEFAQRRSYNQVKRDVHRALPVTILVALGGLGVAVAGAHVRRGGSSDAA